MRDGLPINLDDLLNIRVIESNRIEFKATWNPPIKAAALRTICAFANDLLNLGGGYIILGVEEVEGRPVLPPAGLKGLDLERVQKEIRAVCERFQPSYQPLVFPTTYQGSSLLVIWAPGGDNRPYQVPEDCTVKGSPLQYFVRRGPETIHAKGEAQRQLLEVAAKIPFDDRRHLQARIEDLSPLLVRRFLNDIGSDLVNTPPGTDDHQIYRKLNLVVRVNGYEVPRNVSLLFFHEDPDRFFPGARIEVVQFGDDAGGDLIEERVFRGPIPQQIRATLDYLDSMGGTFRRKLSSQAEIERTVPYPYEALEEALVNAVYHRSYEAPPEPVKVYLYPDRMEITSYPGPMPGIQPRHFEPGQSLPSVAARNRRIGDFLKELRLAEGRGTGIPKIQRTMRQNGSPEARFDFDEERTYFRAVLPVHPRYHVIHALREASHLWAIGEKRQALQHLERSFDRQSDSGFLATQIIEYALALSDLESAEAALRKFENANGASSQPFLTLARFLLDRERPREANAVLARIPPVRSVDDTMEAAILKKRAQDFEGAHCLFAEAYSIFPNDPKLLQEFAQTKVKLAKNLSGGTDKAVKIRLNREAAELLRRAIQITDNTTRQAWCWFDLAQILDWLRDPRGEVETAFLKAISLLPDEERFRGKYRDWQGRRRSSEKI